MSEHDETTFHISSPHSLRPSPPPLQAAGDFPSSTYEPFSNRDTAFDDVPSSDDDAITRIPLPADDLSSRSSISSFPASGFFDQNDCRTPSKPGSVIHTRNSPRSGSRQSVRTPHSERRFPTGFRNPSSVKAMQMRDELFDDTDDRTPQRRKGSQLSYYSHQSATSRHTSPTKRTSHSKQPSSKLSDNVRKEFPLVLLHCTLLPASAALWQAVTNEDVLGDVLPPKYRKRWMTLRDRLTQNPEMQARGLLIPHPKDDYELLEERLLESLELVRPKIRQHHFVGSGSSVDSGFESASQSEEEAEPNDKIQSKCSDCGKHLSMETELEREWEIKVYAGNGLMRSGAWGAAWQDMERVDVEIGVWMPEDIRRALESKLNDLEHEDTRYSHMPTKEPSEAPGDARMREIYGEQLPTRTQEEIDGFQDDVSGQNNHQEHSFLHPDPTSSERPHQSKPRPLATTSMFAQVLDQFRLILGDKRNVLIGVLGVVVLWYALLLTPATQLQLAGAKSSTAAASRHATASASISTSVETCTETVTATITTEVANSVATGFSTDSHALGLEQHTASLSDEDQKSLQSVKPTSIPSVLQMLEQVAGDIDFVGA